MSANGNPSASTTECPVCQEPFDTGVHLPKVLGVCGHSVCVDCLPNCIRRQAGRQGRAKCPLCRQETPVPANGLPTNYALIDTLESQQAAIRNQQAQAAANVQCSGCDKNASSSDVFACKTCTAVEKKVVLVCGVCGMKVHKAHEVVEYDAMAKAADIASLLREERQHNDNVQRQSTELASSIAVELKHLAKDCQVDVDANRPLSLMTKEGHEKHAKESSERRLRSTHTFDAAERIVSRCRQELSALRAKDAQTPDVQQAVASSATSQKRAATSTDNEPERQLTPALKSSVHPLFTHRPTYWSYRPIADNQNRKPQPSTSSSRPSTIDQNATRTAGTVSEQDDSPTPAKLAKNNTSRQ